VLINCAGTSVPGLFEDLDAEVFEKMMRVNYFGSVFPTKAVVPSMKARSSGRIVFVSSQAGQLGVFGFSAYSPSKFALVGLAQVLRMELQPHGVCVSVAYPPDTDTPGFAEENTQKPEETRMISETAGLFKPDQVRRLPPSHPPPVFLRNSTAAVFCHDQCVVAATAGCYERHQWAVCR
jgi:3-dehydrosphinganine reductase